MLINYSCASFFFSSLLLSNTYFLGDSYNLSLLQAFGTCNYINVSQAAFFSPLKTESVLKAHSTKSVIHGCNSSPWMQFGGILPILLKNELAMNYYVPIYFIQNPTERIVLLQSIIHIGCLSPRTFIQRHSLHLTAKSRNTDSNNNFPATSDDSLKSLKVKNGNRVCTLLMRLAFPLHFHLVIRHLADDPKRFIKCENSPMSPSLKYLILKRFITKWSED